MEYKDKLEKMEKHLREHPKDYQSVISYIKTRSDAIDHDTEKRNNERRKKLEGIKLNIVNVDIVKEARREERTQ